MLNDTTSHDSHQATVLLKLGTLWLLLCLAFFAEAEPSGIIEATALGLLALALITAGRFLSMRCETIRPTPRRPTSHLMLLSIGAGLGAGAFILAIEMGLARFDPEIQASFARYYPEPWWHPLERAFSPAIMEEVLARYVLMTGIAVVALRWAVRGEAAYYIALITSSVVFGLLHGPSPDAVGLALLLMNTAGGLLLGWIFWHWGLAQAILCHFIGGVVIQSLGPRLLV